jgi:hypothetical protein
MSYTDVSTLKNPDQIDCLDITAGVKVISRNFLRISWLFSSLLFAMNSSALNDGTWTETINKGNAAVAASDAPIVLNVNSPNNGQIVSDDLTVTATVQSELDIAFVSATVGSRSVELVYSSDAICDRGCSGGFSGLLSLNGMPTGTYTLTVMAEDLSGRSVSEDRLIHLDRSPVLAITEPIQYSVAKPSIPLNITCTDDAGDCEITVSVENTQLASATNSLIDPLDLSSYDGRQISLIIQGTDSSNQITTESITLFVESSKILVNVKNFSGQIISFNGDKVLIKTSDNDGDRLAIASISSNQVISVEVPSGLEIASSHSFLTPTGAIYLSKDMGGTVLSSNIYDWNNNQLIDLGYPDSASSLTVSGDYAIWSVASTLWRRQLSTRTNKQISDTAGNWNNAVASTGVVGYWSYDNNYSIVRYDSGTYTTLATDSNYWNTYVESDGNSFVYRKHDPCCSSQTYAIIFHDGYDEILLTAFRDKEPSPGRDYQINNGWIVYTELGGLGQSHVWSRDASGTLLQRSIFGSDSTVDSLASDGEVMLFNSNKRYLSDTSAQSLVVGTSLGQSSKLNGNWYIHLGRSLFIITDADGDGVADNSDVFPMDANETVDTDSDGIGNNADTDDDGDGVLDTADAFPLLSLGTATDTDADGAPDTCDTSCIAIGMSADTDDDGDGTADTSDAFPLNSAETLDTDNDGVGNNADTDDDGDEVPDADDAFPLDAAESVDTDNDGVGDNADVFPEDPSEVADNDSDGVGDNGDNCTITANSDQVNTDGDAEGDACDADDDNDGFTDEQEAIDGTNPLSVFSCSQGCFSFDIDADEKLEADALTDGLLVIRHLFGFSGDSLIANATSNVATRQEAEEITSYLNDAESELDIDGDGEAGALTDGLLLIRYLFGFSGDALISGAVSENAERTSAEQIEAYISERIPVI